MDLSDAKQIILPLLPYYRWHPEVAIRYWPIAEVLKKSPSGSVLEVGSGGIGIAPYLGRQVTGLDSDFSGPKHPLLKEQLGSGTKLPFANKSFDFVISSDTLEHIAPALRPKVVGEMLRVAKQMVIIAVPTGIESQKQDQLLSDYFEKKFGHRFQFFTEHKVYGLPEIESVSAIIKNESRKLRKKITLSIAGNENLALRYFLMKSWITKNPILDIIHRKLYLFFLPLIFLIDKPPYYRSIYYVTIENT